MLTPTSLLLGRLRPHFLSFLIRSFTGFMPYFRKCVTNKCNAISPMPSPPPPSPLIFQIKLRYIKELSKIVLNSCSFHLKGELRTLIWLLIIFYDLLFHFRIKFEGEYQEGHHEREDFCHQPDIGPWSWLPWSGGCSAGLWWFNCKILPVYVSEYEEVVFAHPVDCHQCLHSDY